MTIWLSGIDLMVIMKKNSVVIMIKRKQLLLFIQSIQSLKQHVATKLRLFDQNTGEAYD